MSTMAPQHYKKVFQRFRIAFFIASIAAFFTMLQASSNPPHAAAGLLLDVWVGVLVLSSCVYLFCLGKLASALGKNPLLWVLGVIVTGPIGAIVMYFVMQNFATARDWD